MIVCVLMEARAGVAVWWTGKLMTAPGFSQSSMQIELLHLVDTSCNLPCDLKVPSHASFLPFSVFIFLSLHFPSFLPSLHLSLSISFAFFTLVPISCSFFPLWILSSSSSSSLSAALWNTVEVQPNLLPCCIRTHTHTHTHTVYLSVCVCVCDG